MALDFHSLARGDALPPIALSVSAEEAAAYLDATGEPVERWADAVPPLAQGALLLGALMEQLALPPGALHTGQEFAFLRAVAPGEPLEGRIAVAQHSERRGSVIAAFDLELRDADGEPVLRGRSTVIAPAREEGVAS